jgi:hypothetical protein
VVKLSNSDATFDLTRPIAGEIDNPPKLIPEKSNVTCERYVIDSKHVLNTHRKLWSLYRLLTSLPVCDVIELVK